jgi:hypothetical protein
MKRKLLALFLPAILLLSLCGCNGTVGQIASNVLDAAVEELKVQVARVIEENKVEVVELKTAIGKLNDEGPRYQFFIAVLVKTNSPAAAQGSADALSGLFTTTGVVTPTGSALESEYLVHKSITFNHSDFSGGNYYVIYGYQEDLTASLPSLTSEPSETTLPPESTIDEE